MTTCIYHLTAIHEPYAIYFTDDNGKVCQLSNECSNDCALEATTQTNDHVVIQHCHGFLNTTYTTSLTTTTSTPTTTTSTPSTTTSMPTTTIPTPTTTSSTPTTTMLTPTTNMTTPTTTIATPTTTTTQTTTTTMPTTNTLTATTPPSLTTMSTLITTTTMRTTTTKIPTITQAMTTQTLASKKPKLFIMPCLCYTLKEWANLPEDEIIKLLIKNLTIDTSNTTLALNKRISRSDPRASSATIGSVATLICIALLCVVVLSDCLRLCRHMQALRKKQSVIRQGCV